MFWANRVPSFADSGRFRCGVASFGLMSPLLSAARMKVEGKKEGAPRGSFLLELLLPTRVSISCGCILHRHVLRGRKHSRCSAASWPRLPLWQTYAKRHPISVRAFCVLQTSLPPPLANGLRTQEFNNSSFAEHARNEAMCGMRQGAKRGKALNAVTGLVETAFESFVVIPD